MFQNKLRVGYVYIEESFDFQNVLWGGRTTPPPPSRVNSPFCPFARINEPESKLDKSREGCLASVPLMNPLLQTICLYHENS